MHAAAFFKGAFIGMAAGAAITATVIPIDRKKARRIPAVRMVERLLTDR